MAAALEDAAARAAARGAGATAIDLGRQAIDHTPDRDGDDFFRRVVALGHHARLTSAEVTDCKDRVQGAFAVCASGELRAGLLLAKQVVTCDFEAGYQLVLQAIEETNGPQAGGPRTLRRRMDRFRQSRPRICCTSRPCSS